MNYCEMNIDQYLLKLTLSDLLRFKNIMATLEFFQQQKNGGIPLMFCFKFKFSNSNAFK